MSDLIPDQVQVLLTHGPPLGHGDVTSSGLRVGCEDLMYTTKSRLSNLKVHLFGHIHEGYGVSRDFNGVVYVVFFLYCFVLSNQRIPHAGTRMRVRAIIVTFRIIPLL